MTKARILANLISDNAELADGQISVAEVVGAAPLASPTFTGSIGVAGNITNASGDLTLDVAGDIILDAAGGDILLKEGGTAFGELSDNSNGDFDIKCPTNNADIRFKGVDGGANVTALRLDMSDAGTAIFNHDIQTGLNAFMDIRDADGDISGRLRNVSGSNNALTIEADPNNSASGSYMNFKVDTGTAMTLDSAHRVLIGHTSSIPNGGDNQQLQVTGTGSSDGISLARFNTTYGAYFTIGRSGSGTVGTYTAVPINDEIGRVQWAVADGTDMSSVGAMINAVTEQQAASNDVPTRLVFSTTADGASSPTERMRIQSNGFVGIGGGGTTAYYPLHVYNNSDGVITRWRKQGATNNPLFEIELTESDSSTILRTSGSNVGPMIFARGSSEAMRITTNQVVLMGATESRTVQGFAHKLQVEGTNAPTASISIVRNTNSIDPPYISFGKTRSGGVNGSGIVQQNDVLGRFDFTGANGSNLNEIGVRVDAWVDGDPTGSTDMPGRLVFQTSADGGASPAERMRISNDGSFGFNYAGNPTGLSPDTGAPLYAFRPAGGANAAQNYLNFGGTNRNGNGLSKMLSFNHGYWGASREVAAIGVETISSSGGSGHGYGDLVFYTGESGNGDSGSTSQERVRINNNGNFYIGTTTSGWEAATGTGYIAGSGYWKSTTSTSSQNAHFYFGNSNGWVGQIYTSGSSTTYQTSSDHRLKENVEYTWDATTRLKQLKPARFNFIADADTTVDGFLAHEAQAVVPESVSGTHNEVDDDGNAVMQGIDQSKLVPLLVKTIQELEARITALENA